MVLLSRFQNRWIYIAIAAATGCLAALTNSHVLFFIIFSLVIVCWFRVSRILALFIGLVGISFFLYAESRLPIEETRGGSVFATVSSYQVKGDTLTGFVILPSNEKIFIRYKMETELEVHSILNQQWTGEIVELHLTLSPPKLLSHPYEFSFDNYLLSQGANSSYTTAVFKLKQSNPQFSWRIKAAISSYRQHFHDNIQHKVPVSLQDEFLSLTIGDRSLSSDEDRRLYQRLGLSHLFAISGLHIALLTGAFYRFMLWCNVRLRTIYHTLLIILPIYMLIAGAAPSVVRATCMVWIVTLLLRLGKKINPSDLLALVLLLTLTYFPFYILQPGYQLSFAAVFSLVYSTKIFKELSGWKLIFMTTLICQIVVLPIVLYHFQQVSIVSLLVNVFAIPLFTFILLPLSMMYSVWAQLPFNTIAFLENYEWIRNHIQDVFIFCSELPYAVWTPPSIVPVLFVSVICVLLTFYMAERNRLKSLGFIIGIALIWQATYYIHPNLQISYLYVGQGDSTLIQFPYGGPVIVIDSGGVTHFAEEGWQENGKYEVGHSVVTPYLRSKGITAIDLLILTHADADHTEGAEELLEDFTVKQIIVPLGVLTLPELEDVKRVAMEKNVPLVEVSSSIHFAIKHIAVTISSIPGEYQGNDSSLLTTIEGYERRFVFSGDLEEDGERKALSLYAKQIEQADVLKLGHHGSKTSSTEHWLTTTRPQLAIVSAGKDNRYGHPHQVVLDRLHDRGIPVLGTYENGTIEVEVTPKGELQVTSAK